MCIRDRDGIAAVWLIAGEKQIVVSVDDGGFYRGAARVDADMHRAGACLLYTSRCV